MEKIFIFCARVEAFTWAGLLVGMYFKYSLGLSEMGVWLFGRLHGLAFISYFFIAIITAIRLKWKWWLAILAVVAAIPPLVTFPLEFWFRKRGMLDPKNGNQCQ